MTSETLHRYLPSLHLRRKRGDDGLTDAERVELAAAWLAGSGERSSDAEMDRLQAAAERTRDRQPGWRTVGRRDTS